MRQISQISLFIALIAIFVASACVTGAGGSSPGGGDPTQPGGGPTQPGGGAPANPDLMARFSGCMTQANWTASNMQLLARAPVVFGSACFSCHSGGMGGLFADTNDAIMFQKNKAGFTAGFFTTEGNQVVPAFAKLDNTGKRNGHRAYDLGQAERDALTQFANLTNACQGGAQWF
jgi:hypothetical protein